jgi:replicative DNA helicase
MSDKPQLRTVFAPQTIGTAAVKVVEERAANPKAGLTTGIEPVDAVLNPHRPGELRIVLGFTRNYKSGLMNYVCRHNARRLKAAGEADKKAVILVTWEQSIEEQGIVDIAQIVALDTTKMMRGDLNDGEWKKLRQGAVQRGALPWWIIGHSSESKERRPRLTITDVALAIEYIVDVQKVEPALIALDFLQRIQREKGESMREQFMTIVDRAKDMALAFHVPVMLGSQAGRQVNSRNVGWRLPQIDDGQETSNLEQSADSFLSVWMPKNDYPTGQVLEYGDKSYTVNDNLLILGILKQKFGPSPRIFELHVKPEVNEIYPMGRAK